MKHYSVFAPVLAAAITGMALSGCAAVNGVNQLVNNVIGTTAKTASNAIRTLTPTARQAHAGYQEYKSREEYEREMNRKAAKYERRHSSTTSSPRTTHHRNSPKKSASKNDKRRAVTIGAGSLP